MPSPDVLILGGGVIGLTTAYLLARDGTRVGLLDKGEFGQESSWAGAGIISPGNPKRAKSAIGQLRARSAEMWPALSAELRERTGLDNGYVRSGGLELRRSEDVLEKLRIENLLREERGEGAHCEVLDRTQLREMEPALSKELPGAVYLPEMAQVRNPRHVKALIAACTSLGVELHAGCPIQTFDRQGERITAALAASERFQADRFLIAAGAWSHGLLQGVGVTVGVKPIRGQIVLLATQPPLLRHIVMAGAEYIVPRQDGRVLLGSTEEDVGFDKRTSAVAVQGLLQMGIHLVPAFASAPVERAWAGLRPGSPDGRPFLGPVPGCTNLFLAAGHFRSGIQNSPGTALVMSEWLTGRPTSIPLDAFRVERSTTA